MSDIFRRCAIFSCLFFTGFCFWKAAAGLFDVTDASVVSTAEAAMSPSFPHKRGMTTPIQEMRPGMRVVGRNPLRLETETTIDPTPEGWRLVSVRMRKEDGTYFEAELLRPLSWIHRHQAQPGATIQLNMPEMYVVGAAEVLSISACPPIDPGDGPVVISTFKNVSHNVLNIYVEGETEPIGVTAGHPIWSEDRQAFIHSDQLQPGERLRSALGKTVRITSIEIRAGPEPVYNLEVAGEHVYSVTNSGLLVHNTGPCESDLITVYRGMSSKEFEALSSGGPLMSPAQLRNVSTKPTLIQKYLRHSLNSSSPPSPFVSLTQSPGVARHFILEEMPEGFWGAIRDFAIRSGLKKPKIADGKVLAEITINRSDLSRTLHFAQDELVAIGGTKINSIRAVSSPELQSQLSWRVYVGAGGQVVTVSGVTIGSAAAGAYVYERFSD